MVIDAKSRLVAVGLPLPGNRNDYRALTESGVDRACRDAPVPADGSYQGAGALMPHRRRPGRERPTPQQEAGNAVHRRARVRVEHAFSRVKNWKILRDCRLRGTGVHHAMPGIAPPPQPGTAPPQPGRPLAPAVPEDAAGARCHRAPLDEVGVRGGVQIGHELLELLQELWRVGGHRGIEAPGERTEELVRPLLDVRAAAQGDEAPFGVLAGGAGRRRPR
ncbi:hypothetical protein GCM10010343_16140 [Streptomyces avidinii]|nr:hypothetical protein GCM10010343_16140 [Streptomyces avidinii]